MAAAAPAPHRIARDQVEGGALAAKPPRAADAVQVGLKCRRLQTLGRCGIGSVGSAGAAATCRAVRCARQGHQPARSQRRPARNLPNPHAAAVIAPPLELHRRAWRSRSTGTSKLMTSVTCERGERRGMVVRGGGEGVSVVAACASLWRQLATEP